MYFQENPQLEAEIYLRNKHSSALFFVKLVFSVLVSVLNIKHLSLFDITSLPACRPRSGTQPDFFMLGGLTLRLFTIYV